MPQLDIVTYFTQVFWLIVVFLSLYYTVSAYYLPKIALILKYRIIYDAEKNNFIKLLTNEISSVQSQQLTFNQINTIKKLSNNMSATINTWYSDSLTQVHHIDLLPVYTNYILNQSLFPAYSNLKQELLKI